jgi:hypothetical protein
MEDWQRLLRRLALGEYRRGLGPSLEVLPDDPRARTLIQLGALLAVDAAPISIQRAVAEASATGDLGADDLVGALVSLVPIIGIARVATVAPKLGLALGYDVEAAFEAR